jgi:glycosyltransferase involved in cell wall biosynthesis
MRIAIDGRELAGQATGVGRYLSELLRAWNELPDARAHEFVICTHAAAPLPALPYLRVSTVTSPGAGGTRWEQLTLPRLLRAAEPHVVFAPAYTAPLRCPFPVVLTVHDVSYCAHPEWFSWREGTRRRLLTRWSAQRAALVLTVSEFSKGEIVRHLGIDAARVRAIYSGPSPVADPASGTDAHAPLVLYVGSMLARRHVPELIDGFARLARRRPDVRLALVGSPRGVPPVDIAGSLRDADLGGRITMHGFVPDAELADLYHRSSAFAFLSSYEGFGLTPLDAIAAGVPPVVLDTPVAREIYGAAAHYVTRPDPALVEAALERVLFDDTERARLAHEAARTRARFSWAESARHTLAALVEAAG